MISDRDLLDEQRKVVSVLQELVQVYAREGLDGRDIKDVALALGCAVDKLAFLGFASLQSGDEES